MPKSAVEANYHQHLIKFRPGEPFNLFFWQITVVICHPGVSWHSAVPWGIFIFINTPSPSGRGGYKCLPPAQSSSSGKNPQSRVRPRQSLIWLCRTQPNKNSISILPRPREGIISKTAREEFRPFIPQCLPWGVYWQRMNGSPRLTYSPFLYLSLLSCASNSCMRSRSCHSFHLN